MGEITYLFLGDLAGGSGTVCDYTLLCDVFLWLRNFQFFLIYFISCFMKFMLRFLKVQFYVVLVLILYFFSIHHASDEICSKMVRIFGYLQRCRTILTSLAFFLGGGEVALLLEGVTPVGGWSSSSDGTSSSSSSWQNVKLLFLS